MDDMTIRQREGRATMTDIEKTRERARKAVEWLREHDGCTGLTCVLCREVLGHGSTSIQSCREFHACHILADLIEVGAREPSESAKELAVDIRVACDNNKTVSGIFESLGIDCWFSDSQGAMWLLADKIEALDAPETQPEARELADRLRAACSPTLNGEVCKALDVPLSVENVNNAKTILADRIERLGSPNMSRYVELPLDADGVPIRIGDVIGWPYSDIVTVCGIGDGRVYYTNGDKVKWTQAAGNSHHVKPRTLEDVVKDMREYVVGNGDQCEVERLMREAYEMGLSDKKEDNNG